MTRLKSALATGALIATVAGGFLAASATAASADMACNRYGECWTVREHYTTYPSALGVIFHDDAWRTEHSGRHWHYRADRPDDHGYYSHGSWRSF